MKQHLLFALAASALISCNNSDQSTTTAHPDSTSQQTPQTENVVDSSKLASIEWIGGTNQDLGSVKDGQVVEVSFKFRNVGQTPLVIEDVSAGCGCTVPEKPAEPYAPGAEGVIKAKFDSRGRKGPNEKYVTVKANTLPVKDHVLTFKVQVTE